MKKETVIVLMSTAVGISIITILSFFIVWIGFPTENPKESFKDALGFSGGLFGGLATFGAAIVAAHLFNDWRDQHNKNIDSQLFMRAYEFIDRANYEIIMITGFLKDFIQNNEKEKHLDALENHSKRLCHLHDTTSITLSNLAYFVNKQEYNEIYEPQILKICESLLLINRVFIDYIRNPNTAYPNEELISLITGLTLETRDRYRGFIVELKKYYKA